MKKITALLIPLLLVITTTTALPFTMERLWVAYGDTAGARFGEWAAGVGDINGDGYGDFVILHTEFTPITEAFLDLYYGGNPPDIIPDVRLTGRIGGIKGGFDLNGDGWPDFVIGAAQGIVEVYFGGPQFDGNPDLILDSPLSHRLGYCDQKPYNMDISGDINGDGYNDIVVYITGDGNHAVLIYLGGERISSRPDFIIENTASVLTVGDFNGDGYDDIVIGMRCFDLPYSRSSCIFFGDPYFEPVPAMMFEGVGCRFVGDFNRDGFEDLQADFNVYAGSSSPNTDIDAGVDLWHTGGWRAGDLNGNGWIDVVGTRGYGTSWGVYLNDGDIHRLERETDFWWGGYYYDDYSQMDVGPAWDIDGDGNDDIIVYHPTNYANDTGPRTGMVEIWQSVPTGITKQEIANLPKEINLFAYPNPFNNLVIINYTLPEDTDVDIIFYDILGREVEKIHKGKERKGTQRLRWEPSEGLPSGLYFVLLRAKDVGKKVAKIHYLK